MTRPVSGRDSIAAAGYAAQPPANSDGSVNNAAPGRAAG